MNGVEPRSISKACRQCGNFFTYDRRPGQRGRDRDFCSRKCGRKFGKRRVEEAKCLTCGKPYRPMHGNTQRYCSIHCRRYPLARLYESKTDRNAAHRARRQLRISNAAYERFTRREIFERDGWLCQLCGDPVERGPGATRNLSPSLDHVVPLVRGGGHTRANVQCAHWICNSKKTFRMPALLHKWDFR